ncbi:MAG: hypothetical protein R3F37_13010 [Candidatus Competibacteraceae bacterium]
MFNVVDPVLTLRQVVESAIRETIGKSTMDFVLTKGTWQRRQIAEPSNPRQLRD